MAVIISNGATTLATASGFYRVESSNMSMFSATKLAFPQTQAVTFANAGNCQGLVLSLFAATAAAASTYKSVIVTLQENVATVWTDRTSVTILGSDIGNATANAVGSWVVPFVFGTPYAVDTTASKWRFNLTQGAGTNAWQIRTSNATAAFYATWCDNAVTATNNDTVIVKDTVVIDKSFTAKGTLGTGDAVNGTAILICKSTNPVPASVSLLKWEAVPVSSYTLTIDGCVTGGSHSGWDLGTSSARIPFAQQAIISMINPTVGTRNGVVDADITSFVNSQKFTMQFFGEIPAVRKDTLAVDTSIAGTSITTTNSTGWKSGQRIWVGKQTPKQIGDTAIYTLNGDAAGTSITTTVGLATNVRKAGGYVVRLDGYGIRFLGQATTRPTFTVRNLSNHRFSGCQFEEFGTPTYGQNGTAVADDAANITMPQIDSCVFYNTAATLTALAGNPIPAAGLLIDDCHFIRVCPLNTSVFAIGTSGSTTFQNCFTTSFTSTNMSVPRNFIHTGNYYEACNTTLILNSVNLTNTNNKYWGMLSAVSLGSSTTALSNVLSWSGDTYDNCTVALSVGGIGVFNVIAKGLSFGADTANTTDVDFSSGATATVVLDSPLTAVNVSTANILANSTNGTKISIPNYNNTANDDRSFLTYGQLFRTGYSLADTTVWTGTAFGASSAGQFGMRLQPNHATNLLKYTFAYTTGDIHGKTMAVGVRLKINNAAYYAGTNTLPRLRVTYDNVTDVTAQAAANTTDQQILVTFTPATTYGSITVQLECATDAAGSNAYVYVGEQLVIPPPGVSVDTTRFGFWSQAYPLPSIATFVTPSSAWDELMTNHKVAGSFGSFNQTLLPEAVFIALTPP